MVILLSKASDQRSCLDRQWWLDRAMLARSLEPEFVELRSRCLKIFQKEAKVKRTK